VSHHRLLPKRYSLRHRVYWLLLDLAELPALQAGLKCFSHNRFNLMSLYDRDHGDGTGRSLLAQSLDLLRAAGLDDTGVTVQLLCMPRVAGYDFNPLSVYFCQRPDGRPAAIIYEVNNTYGGRHRYVIPASEAANTDDGTIAQSCPKAFYVSPFMAGDLNYRFLTRLPGDEVRVAVQVCRDDQAIINTELNGCRFAISDSNIVRLAAKHPLLPFKVTGAIYWHALRMWLRGFSVNGEVPGRATTTTIISSGAIARTTRLSTSTQEQ
jgi:DUF1365 family protein